MRKLAGGLGLLLALSGCSTLDQSKPTMAADPAELGVEGLIYQNELLAAYEQVDEDKRKLCRLILPSFQERDKWSYRRYEAQGDKHRATSGSDGSRTAERFQCVQFTALKSGAEGSQQIARHVQAGLALSKLYCENYFDRIALHVGKRGFWQGVTNDVGAAMSAVLGLASAGTGVTSGAGVGFGLVDGAFRNYNGQFVVGPDLAIIRNAVLGAQADKAKAIRGSMPTSFADANVAIMEHAKICSFLGMKGLVNDRVANLPSTSREALIDYVAKFQITQEDIDKDVAAKRKAKEQADKKAAETEAAAEAARKAAEEAARNATQQPVANPPATEPDSEQQPPSP